ncbi:hypothetical protein BS78_03G123300 [Paspalum vaginatum]|nr:hypothetical protein BS78_03G123300 [Paspalum vaginatum]
MEDLAASLVPHSSSHSAPLYLLYDVASIAKHGLAPPPLHHLGEDDDDGFEFAAVAAKNTGGAALRACASDVSAAAFADELFRAGALMPLSLPPRLQRPAFSAGASAATSPTSSSSANSRRHHRGFDPFAAALEKVRRDGYPAPAAAAAPRRARSLSPLRAADASSASARSKNYAPQPQPQPAAAQKARRGRKGVRHLLYRVLMASAAAKPRAMRTRAKDGVPLRPGLLVCLGYGV